MAQTAALASAAANPTATPPARSEAPSSEMEALRQSLRQQQDQIDRLRALLDQQSQLIQDLRRRVTSTEARLVTPADATLTAASTLSAAAPSPGTPGVSQNPAPPPPQNAPDPRLAKLEKAQDSLAKQLAGISFSGDLRFRYEALYGQQNTLANSANPALLGNDLSPRQRFRLRARLALKGAIGSEFDWGLRFATGAFADNISTNQTLSDFFNRKPLALDQAYLAYQPRRVPGLRLQAGKFDAPWTRTEMTLDNDVQPEGFSESYSRNFKRPALKNLTLVAWQLPLLERNAGFVRNADGTVNLDESRRASRDLALYGAQARARFEPTRHLALTLSAADLYYSGTQFISPVQVFGNSLQVPVTVTLPGGGTASGVATIARDLLVGGGSLGLTNASTNAVNRDGRLASGYNLADFIGRVEWTGSARWPVLLQLNVVRNTQTHDVVIAGAGGRNQFLHNGENMGYWAEAQAGRLKERGDVQVNYTFLRIEKDAVLTPFNISDIAFASDVRAHRVMVSYQADARVLLTLTTSFSQRANGLLGPFGVTPPGSEARTQTRVQFDTIFRF